MSSKPRLVVSNSDPVRRAGPKSLPKLVDRPRVVDGRGDAGRWVGNRRRSLVVAEVTRADAIDVWVALIARNCGTREVCAVMFGVTFQTACNWFDGVTAPSAAAVMQAVVWWPEAFAALGSVRGAA